MHGKERALAPPLETRLGLAVEVPAGLDTDALGTFTGEVPRRGSMRDAALAKARLGMERTGLALGLASEGSYGPHPAALFLEAGLELVVFVDDERGLVVCEQILDEDPRFGHVVAADPAGAADFLERVGFPSHGLVVGANAPPEPPPRWTKGLRDHAALESAIRDAAAASADGRALVQTDMRAHQNPTRMATLARLAGRLAARLATPCPACDAPGFGVVGVRKGLPCRVCGGPSTLVAAEVLGCAGCDHRCERVPPEREGGADPRTCTLCNP